MHVYVLYVNQQDDPFTVFNPDQHSFETRVAGGAGGAPAPGAGRGDGPRAPARGATRPGGRPGLFRPRPPGRILRDDRRGCEPRTEYNE